MNKRSRLRGGFTLIEIMVVLAIIGILATFLVPRIIDRPDQARVIKARQDILMLTQALQMYRLDSGFYPSTEQGLQALVTRPDTDPIPMGWKPGGYIEGSSAPRDPWGNLYIYRNLGGDIEIISFGADGKEGGDGFNADISSRDLR